MPLYEYLCTDCGKLTEKRQKFSDPELTECPHCKGRLERTITAPAVQFKGGGWYADLYSSGKKSAAAPAADTGGSGETSSASDGQSKPATEAAKGSAGGGSSATPAAPATAPPPTSAAAKA